MLTLESILRTTKQISAFGEGRHKFGEGTKPLTTVPRDREAVPKVKTEK